jgi:hypothetical protein
MMPVQPDPLPAQVEPEADPLTPLWDEAEFAQEVAELVAAEAPRLFAVVQEYGERLDGRIAAWGLAFEDHADVIGVDHRSHLRLRSPERAVHLFSRHPRITARVTWVHPDISVAAKEASRRELDSSDVYRPGQVGGVEFTA